MAAIDFKFKYSNISFKQLSMHIFINIKHTVGGKQEPTKYVCRQVLNKYIPSARQVPSRNIRVPTRYPNTNRLYKKKLLLPPPSILRSKSHLKQQIKTKWPYSIVKANYFSILYNKSSQYYSVNNLQYYCIVHNTLVPRLNRNKTTLRISNEIINKHQPYNTYQVRK